VFIQIQLMSASFSYMSYKDKEQTSIILITVKINKQTRIFVTAKGCVEKIQPKAQTVLEELG